VPGDAPAPASPADRCATAPQAHLAGSHGVLAVRTVLAPAAPGAATRDDASAAPTGYRTVRLDGPRALVVASDVPFTLFGGDCAAPMAVAPRDAATTAGPRALYTLGAGEYVLVSTGDADTAALDLAWVEIPAGRDHLEWGRWSDATRVALSAGGVTADAEYTAVCQRDDDGQRVRLLWDADGTGPATRRFELDRLGGARTPADGAVCAQTVTVSRGLVALEAHRMGAHDPVTVFTAT